MFIDIKGYEGLYGVSKCGEVKSFSRVTRTNCPVKERILKPTSGGYGYHLVGLWKDGVRKPLYIHRIVAEMFLAKPEGKNEVNHKNGNKTDNSVENLEWVTASENKTHAFATGLNSQKHAMKPVICFDKRSKTPIKEYTCLTEAEKVLSINRLCIARCCNKEQKTAGGFYWEWAKKEENNERISENSEN